MKRLVDQLPSCPVAQFGVQPHKVVEVDDVVIHVVDGFAVIGVITLPNPLHLQIQIQDQALHHRVIPVITFAAHAAREAMVFQQRLIRITCVLGESHQSSPHF